MSLDFLNEAFSRLNKLNEDTFAFSDEGIAALDKFTQDLEDDAKETVEVIDPDAETDADLQDTYEDRVILECPICHSNIFKPQEEVIVDEGTQMANVEEMCPYCTEVGGFNVVGKVCAFTQDNTPAEAPIDEPAVPQEPITEGLEKDTDVIAKQVLDILGKHGIALGNTAVLNYAQAAAILIASADEDYSVEQWYEDTVQNYPEDLEALKGEDVLKESATTNVYKVEYIDTANPEKILTTRVRAASEDEVIAKMTKHYDDYVFDKITLVKADKRADKNSDTTKDITVTKYTDADKKAVLVGAKNESCKKASFANKIKKKMAERLADNTTPIKESISSIEIETDSQKVSVADGVTTIADKTVTPEIPEAPVEDLTIQPIDDTTKEDIINNTDDNVVNDEPNDLDSLDLNDISDEEPEKKEDTEADEVDLDIDDIKEENFNVLGNKFLKNIYENVNSFKTVNVKANDTKLIVEGVITFNSGKTKKTQFMFEAKDITKTGKIRFVGENMQICGAKKAFVLTGSLNKSSLITESLNYNFTTKDAAGKSTRISGTVSVRK